jgi:hypothetical protein
MFRDWENFYLLVGSAAGALIGLMFVVAMLTAGLDSKRVAQGARVYVTPIVFHFAVVLLVSTITAVPGLVLHASGAILAGCAAVGFVYSGTTTIRMFGRDWDDQPDLSDKFFYGIAPALLYLLGGAGALGLWLSPENAAYVIGGTMLALLLVGIRNAWDLATFLVHRPHQRRADKD